MTVRNTPIPFFITFSGKKQSGKDTAAQMAKQILEESGKTVASVAFADPLKTDICANVLGLDLGLLYGSDEDKNTLTDILWDTFPIDIRMKYSEERDEYGRLLPRTGPMTYREVLQVIGSDVFRSMIYHDVWAELPFRQDWHDTDVVLLTDCRFPNEKEATEQNGGVVIRIERDTGLEDYHLSETALDNTYFNYVYHNNGSLEELRTFVNTKLAEFGLL